MAETLDDLLYKVDPQNILESLHQAFKVTFKAEEHSEFRRVYKQMYFFQVDKSARYHVDIELTKCVKLCLIRIKANYPLSYPKFRKVLVSMLNYFDNKAREEAEFSRFPSEFFLDEEDFLK